MANTSTFIYYSAAPDLCHELSCGNSEHHSNITEEGRYDDALCHYGEAEAYAGVDAPALHALYEKARYGPVPCTQADVKGLK